MAINENELEFFYNSNDPTGTRDRMSLNDEAHMYYANANEGGGTTPPPTGGSGWEVGDIRTTHKDKVITNWVPINEDKTFHRDDEGILFGDYQESGGQFIETSSYNDLTTKQATVRIHEYANGENLYMTFLNSKSYIFKDFQNRSDLVECTFTFSDGINYNSLGYLMSSFNNCLVFKDAYNKNFFKVTMDYTLATTTDIVNSTVNETFDYFDTYGATLYSEALQFTRDGIMAIQNISTWADVKQIPWDLNKANVVQHDLSSIPSIGSDPSSEKGISYNGGVLSRGRLYNYTGGIIATIVANNDHRYYFSMTNTNGVDIISFAPYNNTTRNYCILEADGTATVIPYAVTPPINYQIIAYNNDNNFLWGSSTTTANSRIYSHRYSNGVFEAVTNRYLCETKKQFEGNQFTRPQIIGLDQATKSIAYTMDFITEVPDLFMVKQELTTSDDKVKQILTESGVVQLV